ncbi:MAG: putative arsenical pump-driving ATPase [Methanonatronarchaeales archaeon]|nr:putative arsenical pump-driving ATPase [Methanonatronarchaeales archaeon]
MPQFILYGGKGGVGKTSCAAATALALAERGHRTLVVSTDPAHSLGDIFEDDVGWEETRLEENLFAVEIDPERALKGWREEIVVRSEGMPAPLREGVGELIGGEDALAAPGMDEAAAMDRFMQYMNSDYDYVVLDTAPTGHTLRLLELPEFLDTMMGRLIKVRVRLHGLVKSVRGLLGQGGEPSERGDVERLEEVKRRIERARAFLMDPERTDFRMVMNPEALSIQESRRMVKSLERYQIPVRTIVINKIVRDPGDCEFCVSRSETQGRRLEQAHELFGGLEAVEIPLFSHEVQGRESLRKMGRLLV